jgi:ATP-dependent Clp protease ATP-binding subunit ClpA
MFERFTERARRVIILAQEEAKRLNHSAVGTEHILLGIVREGEGVASKVLESLNISPERVRAEIESAIGRGERTPHEEVTFTPRAKKVLELALDEARRLGHNYIGTEHLLLGLIGNQGATAGRVLDCLGLEREMVRDRVQQMVEVVGAPAEPAGSRLAVPTAQVKKVIESSFEEARSKNCSYVGTEHLLLGLLLVGEGVAAAVLRDLGVTADRVREEAGRLLAEGSREESS